MQFKKTPKQTHAEIEHDIISYWKKNKTFQKSVDNRPVENSYVFYDGPPFITGLPHYGSLLSSIAKDAVPRYWTMRGKRVERVWGWDCHGLPAENFVEKKLGIKDKRDVATIGLEKYIETCHASMIQVGSEWEDTIDRIGRWVEFKGAYKTMDKPYMESVWWAFKTLYEKGKIYEGERVLMYCTRCATPISKSEVAMDNSYQDVTDPSVFVKFKSTEDDFYYLAWTTTPWTLHANTALAVNPELEYALVDFEGTLYVLAKEMLDKVFVNEKHEVLPYEILHTMPGQEIVGKTYVPLYGNRGENAHRILAATYVTTEAGSGLVHLAPAYGEEDYVLAKSENLPIYIDIDENGLYKEGPWKGQNIWEANKPIAKELYEKGTVFKIEYIRHSYPHCHRCSTKLMYRAHPSWFMNIQDQRTLMLEQNENINWYPDHIKNGRFEHTVASAPDWNLSRDRFWATAMPVWRGVKPDGTEVTKVVGSYEELKELSGIELEDYHRPYIDSVTFEYQGATMKRIDKVFDCWFESGSMPFAQFHYPFENKEKFETNFPGDFIVEYVAQVRAWFYYMHAVSIGLFGKSAFKHVVVTGTIAGNDGRKMSKSLGNYTDPNVLLDQYSADALRCHLLESSVMHGEDFAMQDKGVADTQRRLNTLKSTLDFFLLYAEADKWQAKDSYEDELPESSNILDQWIIGRLCETREAVDDAMEGYDTPLAITPLFEFIEDLSNWYIRRSRKRFWKSESDADKLQAYQTLYFVLVYLSKLIAPFAPFLAEYIYRTLTGKESVHLCDWPKTVQKNGQVLEQMKMARDYINQGLSLRAAAKLKVRQPLASAAVPDATEEYLEIIAEELNVKTVNTGSKEVEIDTNITPELRAEGLMRDIVRNVQQARKDAGLQVDDRIKLALTTDNAELLSAIETFKETIMSETLATAFATQVPDYAYITEVKVEGNALKVSLEAKS